MFTSFSEIVDAFTLPVLAKTLNLHSGLISNWRKNNAIPAKFWDEIVALGRVQQLPVSLEIMSGIAARKGGRAT